jgi:hypothetical protein
MRIGLRLTCRIHSVMAQACAIQIGSRMASGVDLYSIVKELVGRRGEIRREPGHRISFFWWRQSATRGWPYLANLAGAESNVRLADARGSVRFSCGCGHLAARFRVYVGFRVVAGLVEALIPVDKAGDFGI